MREVKIFIGIILLFISIGYLYRPNFIIRINEWGRKYIFNDVWVLSHRWEIGGFFLVLSLIALYMGITSL